MNDKRGCMAALLHEGYIFVIGGLNYTEKCLKRCERYRLIASHNSIPIELDEQKRPVDTW